MTGNNTHATIKVSAKLAARMDEYAAIAMETADIAEVWSDLSTQLDEMPRGAGGVLAVDAAMAYELRSWADSEADYATDQCYGDALAAGAYKAMMLGLVNRADKALAKIAEAGK
jgi:hypothetical protein